MAKQLGLTVLTPAEALLRVDGVEWVQVQLADGGGIGIFPGHAPLIAETVTGPVRYADEAGEHAVAVDAGILQIDREGVTILAGGFADAQTDAEYDGRRRFERLAQTLAGALGDEAAGILGTDEVQ